MDVWKRAESSGSPSTTIDESANAIPTAAVTSAVRTAIRRPASVMAGVLQTGSRGRLTARRYTLIARYPLRNWSWQMFESVNVIGRGRVGTAFAARLGERGGDVRDERAERTT